jgi:molecular chaperone GrpE
MSDQNPKIEIDPSLMDEAVKAVEDPKEAESTKESQLDDEQQSKIQQEPNADEYRDRWIRVTADFDNFRKRVQKEKADMIKYGNENLIKELLPVLDNFERAMAAPAQNDSYAQGVQMIYTQLMSMLERFGVTTENVKGKIFDPNLHEAMSYKEDGSVTPHTILEEHQRMYFLNKKLIRPALVTVSKGEASTEAPTVELSSND